MVNPSLAYLLGRKTAPLFYKAEWIFKSLAGSESEKIRAEYKMGVLLARAYEEKIASAGNNRLDKIADRLTNCLRNPDRRFEFKCDQSGVLNALAIPGGFIYIAEELFDECGEDLDAIAFVLAHEMAHIIHGDANKRFLTKSAVNGILRGAHPATHYLIGQLLEKGYSREQEYRADRFAIALMKAAKLDPFGGIRLLQQLQKHTDDPTTLGVYFSSHPSLTDRIQTLNDRIASIS